MCEQLKTAVLVPQLTHLDELLSAVEGVTEALKQEPVARLLDQATGGKKKNTTFISNNRKYSCDILQVREKQSTDE